MKTLPEKVENVIMTEKDKNANSNQLEEFAVLLDKMKKSGIVKRPDYTLPLVDTIGKTYYSTINKSKSSW